MQGKNQIRFDRLSNSIVPITFRLNQIDDLGLEASFSGRISLPENLLV